MSSPIDPTGRHERAVLAALRSGVVCGTRTAFYDFDAIRWLTVRRLAPRVKELRDKGWPIETVRWCDQHPHPESKQIMYRLVK